MSVTSVFKSAFKSLLRRFGYDVVRYFPYSEEIFLPPFDVLPFLLKAYLKEHLEANPDFFFVQVGAYDGITWDPLRESILAYHLPGLLIEPLPDHFSKLCENYKSEPQLRFENVAIAAEAGRIPFYRVKRGQGLPWQQLLSSFDRELIKGKVDKGCIIEEEYVEAATLPSLLNKHGIKKVSLLQVDAEGYDYQIVKLALESGIRPDIINYEQCNLSRADQIECKRMLRMHNYVFVDIGADTLCVQEKGQEKGCGGNADRVTGRS